MEPYTFRAEKPRWIQWTLLTAFIIIPGLFAWLGLIDVAFFVQISMLVLLFLAILLIVHITTTITITSESIRANTLLKKHEIKWTDAVTAGVFHAAGLSLADDHLAQNKMLSVKYIYVTTENPLKLGMLRKNSRSFIRFQYDQKAFELIRKYCETCTD